MMMMMVVVVMMSWPLADQHGVLLRPAAHSHVL
jgi:hypothetical protein